MPQTFGITDCHFFDVPHGPSLPLYQTPSQAAFAIGNPFYFEGLRLRGKSPDNNRLWLRHKMYELDVPLETLVTSGLLQRKALVLVDLDCAYTSQNIDRVNAVMGSRYSKTRYGVTFSGNSLHLTLEDPIDLSKYAASLGSLVEAFADTTVPARQHIIKQIGRDLILAGTKSNRLNACVRLISESICHYDSPKAGKFPFMIDLLNVAAAIREYARFLQDPERMQIFGDIRIVPKHTSGKPPNIIRKARFYKGKTTNKKIFFRDNRSANIVSYLNRQIIEC